MSDAFPVVWQDPADEKMTWFQESAHFPETVSPLDFSVLIQAMRHGINYAAKEYELGFSEHYRQFNTFVYRTFEVHPLPPEEMARQEARSDRTLDAAINELGNRWAEQWLPEIKSYLAAWQACDLDALTLPELLTHFEESLSRHQRLWEIHFLIFYPMLLALQAFDELCAELLQDSDQFSAYDLLAGPNQTTKGDVTLWQLSRQALTVPAIEQCLTHSSTAQVYAALEQSPPGQNFSEALQTYLQTYGLCSDKTSLAAPYWIEEPIPIFQRLRTYMAQPDRDLRAEMVEKASKRAAKLVTVRAALAGYPAPVIAEFDRLQTAAEVAYRLSEDHHYWIDGQGNYYMRQRLLAVGRRLVELKMIETVDDVFYLTIDEIKSAATAAPTQVYQSIVAEQRAQEARFTNSTPLPLVGAPQEEEYDDPFSRSLEKFFGGPPPMSTVEDELAGYAGSPGIVSGTARVVRALAEADGLQPGDILVTSTTTPAWTALFATIAAVVTDSGGVLSHCAVVAREYGLPAVVGAGMATAVIVDGQLIEVNGHTGVVRFL